MAHWSGTRSGWNTRGGTDKSRFRQLMRDQEEARELSDPDSPRWESRARSMMDILMEKIGQDDYDLWCEMTFPGESIQALTWQQIHETFRNYHDEDLICSCSPASGMACRVCMAYARLHNNIDELA